MIKFKEDIEGNNTVLVSLLQFPKFRLDMLLSILDFETQRVRLQYPTLWARNQGLCDGWNNSNSSSASGSVWALVMPDWERVSFFKTKKQGLPWWSTG